MLAAATTPIKNKTGQQSVGQVEFDCSKTT
jgi:hypothetical protein